MLKRIFIFISFIILITPALSFAALNGFAHITLITGDVQFRDTESDDWLPAAINTPLMEGDSIWCPAGARAEIKFKNGTILRLDSESALDLTELTDDFQRVHLDKGRLFVKTGRDKGALLQLDFGDASATADPKSRIKIDLDEQTEEISIISGAAYMESAGQRTRVRAGETLTVTDNSSEVSALKTPDEWERWNTQREKKQIERKQKVRYLSDELSAYEKELSDNGEWVVDEEHGRVWRPTVVVESDWAPYRTGRWIWRGGDYVWVSYEPWGWAPYHYGRWAVIAGRGWCWIPPVRGDIFWAPGYVAWVSTSVHIGWVPLAPGEIYYGRGHYGRHSVNIIDNRRVVHNVNVYRNGNVRNSITVVNRGDFGTGRGHHQAARENIFQKPLGLPSSPDIRPTTREARMPVVRKVSQGMLPPPAIGRKPVKTINEHYPRLKDVRRTDDAIRERSRQRSASPEDALRERHKQSPVSQQTVVQPGKPTPAPALDKREHVGDNNRKIDKKVEQENGRVERERPKKAWRVETREKRVEKIQQQRTPKRKEMRERPKKD